MTLAEHWPRFRTEKGGPILDWKRFELAAFHYEPVLNLTPAWFTLATRLAMASGQRINAVLGLRWEQVSHGLLDFAAGAAARQKRRGVIPILPDVQALLDAVTDRGEYVIGGRRRIHYHIYLHQWRKVCAAAGVDGASPHSIRHGVATALISAGVPMLEVSQMLGHSSIAITQKVYVKFDPTYTKNAASRMAAMLS